MSLGLDASLSVEDLMCGVGEVIGWCAGFPVSLPWQALCREGLTCTCMHAMCTMHG